MSHDLSLAQKHAWRLARTRILQSPECLRLADETIDFATGARVPARLTTRAMIKLENEMVSRAGWLSGKSGFGVKAQVLEAVFARHDRLSDEQRTAIEHVAAAERIATVVGRALLCDKVQWTLRQKQKLEDFGQRLRRCGPARTHRG